MKKTVIFFVLMNLCLGVFAQQSRIDRRLDRIFRHKGQICFSFQLHDKSEIGELTKMISIDHVDGLSIKAYANKEQFRKFLQLHKRYRIIDETRERTRVRTGLNGSRDLNLTAYPTYQEYVALMQNFASQHSDICTLHNLGSTPNGHDLWIVKISDNVSERESEPQFLYTSTMHGDETAGYIMMLNFIDWLLNGNGVDADATWLVANAEIWINPLANPDGTYLAGDNDVSGAQRYNANNVDLNRNFPDPQDGAHPDGNAWQQETLHWMGFADTMDFVMAANFHGGAEVFNYPWDTKALDHPDRNWWQMIGQNYVNEIYSAGTPNYFTDNLQGFDGPGLTNGFAWYEVNGGRQDYMNAFRHCREVTVELSVVKLVDPSQFQQIWNDNKQSLIQYIRESFNGINGSVTDACTGQGVKAKIWVNNHDADSSHVFSSLPHGNYYRPIKAGNYSVTWSAPGYESITLNNIQVNDGAAIVQNIVLQPSVPSAAFTSNDNGTCGNRVQFNSGPTSASSYEWHFGDGTTSNEQNPLHQYTATGNYDVSLSVSNCAGSDTLTIVNYIQSTWIPLPVVTPTINVCAPQSVTLNAAGQGDIAWYDAPAGGNLVATGNSFQTPVLNQNTMFYVASRIAGDSAFAGLPSNSAGGGGYYTGPTFHYLVFDALQSFTLESVVVYANSAGIRNFYLRNSAGTVLQQLSANLAVGANTIVLNFNIPVGTALQLGADAANNLYRNNAGASYPYTVAGILSITGNSANNPAYYYYFYNWKIKQYCTSATVPVSIVVENSTAASYSIAASSNAYCEGSTAIIQATTNLLEPHYQWYVNGNLQGEPGATLNLTNPVNGDIVYCVVSSDVSCFAGSTFNTNEVTLTVNAIPTAPAIQFVAPNLVASNSNATVNWYLNGQFLGSSNNGQWTPMANGNYTAANVNGDCVSSFSNNIQVNTIGIEEIKSNSCKIFPNPTEDKMTIEWNGLLPFQFELYNCSGQIVQRSQINFQRSTINMENLPIGLYLAKIQDQKSVITQSLMKK